MEKEKFLSKLNIKDYNNQLERILTKKNFSEDTKNLLLSMLYKMENSYSDYSKANVDVKSKSEILEEVLQIIENDCDIIEIIKDRKSESNAKEKKVITYLNAKAMLYELYQLCSKKFEVPEKYEIIKKSIETTLNQAYSIAGSEIIRDFDGWSWNIVINEIENIKANFAYQIIKILVGNEVLINWKNNINNEDYYIKLLEMLQNNYKNELGENILKHINQLAILNTIENDKEELNKLIKIQKDLQKEYKLFDDKEEYLKKLANTKKKATAEISKIDKTINDDKLLKREFITRNEKLDMNNRIFSLSDLVDVMQIERNNLIKKIDECTKRMEPLNYIRMKTDIETKLNLLNELNLQSKDKEIYDEKVKETLELVCKALKIQIINNVNKEEAIRLIYKIRYLELIYTNENKQVKNVVSLNRIQKEAITQACKQKAVTIFSKNIKENYQIAKNIFEIDVIELEKIYFKLIENGDKTILEIYDEDNLYKTVQLSKIQDINVKYNKKIKFMIS